MQDLVRTTEGQPKRSRTARAAPASRGRGSGSCIPKLVARGSKELPEHV